MQNPSLSALRTACSFICASLCLFATPAQSQDFSQVEIKAIPVAKNIFMLQGSGGNIGVSVGDDGLLIVDDQYAPLAEKIEAALKQLNPGKLKFVINTHYHGDHTGGNPHFGQSAPIIAHASVRKRLSAGNGMAHSGLPVITFDDSLSVHFNGEEIKLLHLGPGHTDGDCVIHFTGANVYHLGDQFFSGRFPNIDLGGGGDVLGYLKNVEFLLQEIPADAKLIPGHGPLSTIAELQAAHEMLLETIAVVQNAIAAGQTLDQIKAAGLPAKWKTWEAPTLSTSRWLEIIYQSLTRK